MVVLKSLVAPSEADEFPAQRFYLISITLLLGIATAAATGWGLSKALDDPWRRGVIAALSVFGSALLATLAMPIDLFSGTAGLACYLAALVAAALYANRLARRAASHE
jgi:hypothetical protein